MSMPWDSLTAPLFFPDGTTFLICVCDKVCVGLSLSLSISLSLFPDFSVFIQILIENTVKLLPDKAQQILIVFQWTTCSFPIHCLYWIVLVCTLAMLAITNIAKLNAFQRISMETLKNSMLLQGFLRKLCKNLAFSNFSKVF